MFTRVHLCSPVFTCIFSPSRLSRPVLCLQSVCVSSAHMELLIRWISVCISTDCQTTQNNDLFLSIENQTVRKKVCATQICKLQQICFIEIKNKLCKNNWISALDFLKVKYWQFNKWKQKEISLFIFKRYKVNLLQIPHKKMKTISLQQFRLLN